MLFYRIGVEPLYDKLSDAIINNPDNEFYNLLATVDALREPRLRERNLAKEQFKIVLDDYAKKQNNFNTAH